MLKNNKINSFQKQRLWQPRLQKLSMSARVWMLTRLAELVSELMFTLLLTIELTLARLLLFVWFRRKHAECQTIYRDKIVNKEFGLTSINSHWSFGPTHLFCHTLCINCRFSWWQCPTAVYCPMLTVFISWSLFTFSPMDTMHLLSFSVSMSCLVIFSQFNTFLQGRQRVTCYF